MLDTLTFENWRDFTQRYQGTYGWLLNDTRDNKTLVYIRKVAEDKVTFQDITGRSLHANAGQNVLFEFLPVTRGWFYNNSGDMWLLARRAARQWHRGICEANTTTYSVRSGSLRATAFGLAELYDIFEAKTQHPYKATDTSIWSKQFATVNGDFYLYDKIIGSYSPILAKVILLPECKLLRQEVMDVINRNNLKATVE